MAALINAKMPDFFIPGAPKCGTTTLAGWLARHPLIGFSNPKEPRFFNSDFDLPNRPVDLSEYLDLFPNRPDGGLLGEATTGYMVSKSAIASIRELRPDAKFIMCLRNPIDLFVSLHRQRLKEGYENILDPYEAWKSVSARRDGRIVPKLCPDPQMLDYYRYCAIGDQLELLQKFAPQNTHVVFAEDLSNKPQATFDSVCDFLGLPLHEIDSSERVNTARVPRSPIVSHFLRCSGQLRNKLGFKKGFGIAKKIERFNLKKPEVDIDAGFREEIYEHLDGQIRKVSKLTGRKLGHWR
ncbi:sulfotransferase domain-containing protein [Halomonas sp. 18H]|nr:sulfotransferase [Halomonas sp. 18H]MCW4153901.1 sulfotransferase domain-containing protein [Halomonas sp. 18H]